MLAITYHEKSQVFFCDIVGPILVGLKEGNVFFDC